MPGGLYPKSAATGRMGTSTAMTQLEDASANLRIENHGPCLTFELNIILQRGYFYYTLRQTNGHISKIIADTHFGGW